jgi:hypothetical protein
MYESGSPSRSNVVAAVLYPAVGAGAGVSCIDSETVSRFGPLLLGKVGALGVVSSPGS